MTRILRCCPLVFLIFLIGCGDETESFEGRDAGAEVARLADMPLLRVKPGDRWVYQVELEIPEGVSSPTAAAVHTSYLKERVFLGKQLPADGLPMTDCFEVRVPGSAAKREFVELRDDRILLRGELVMRADTVRPLWFDPAVPFVIAGMEAGDVLPEVKSTDGVLTRRSEVVAREDVLVPAGKFSCIRILTTGRDGALELRRTVWFAPKLGIVREQRVRYRDDRLVFREEQELSVCPNIE